MDIRYVYAHVAVGALVLLPACGGSDATPDEGLGVAQETPDEEIAVTELSLHEVGCWTNTIPHFTFFSHGASGTYTATSPDASYTKPNCPNQWVVEVDQVFNRRIQLWANPKYNNFLPPGYCEGYWSFAKAKGWKNGAWHDIHTWNVNGVGLCFDNACACMDSPGNGVIIGQTHGYSKVRVVAAAAWGLSYQRVSAGVSLLPPVIN